MSERWNINSALRSALGASNGGSGSGNGSSNGTGNNGSAGFAGGSGDGGGGGTTFSAANGESGILRKTGHYHQHGGAPENFDDLLVFGYSCKVFRDDEKARNIDHGRHLIPWMGDNQLKIDRYDARGALHDLSPYEPPPGGYKDRLEGLTAAEQKAEQLCEEERYYSLYNNEVEEEFYLEEALKRRTMLGNQVAFNYDAPQPAEGAIVATVADRTPNSADEQDNDPYVLPKNFEVPAEIPLPETMKEHTIIEKTARFIASQDAQMEILLKTKQSNNPQFEFLTQGTRLFRYYRHVLLAFRTNQYPTEVDQPEEEEENGKTATDGEAEQSALSAQIRPKIVVPAIKYKPSADCAYTQLISKITGAPIPTMVADEAEAASQAEAPVNAQQLTSLNSEFDYYQESSTSSASVEVKKVSTGLAGLVQYNSDSGGSDDDDEEDTNDQQQTVAGGRKVAKPLAPFEGTVPPVTVQHVIDRTAIYVAKNGYSFEEALRVKNDPRFVFLIRTHEYYPYYAYQVRHRMTGAGVPEGSGGLQQPVTAPPSPSKVTIRTETENGTVVETTPSLGIKAVHTAVPKVQPTPVTNIQHQKLGAPVSFSLVTRKAKDEGGASKTVPDLGGSEDEEEEGGKQQTVETVDEANRDRDRADGQNTAQAGAEVVECSTGGAVDEKEVQKAAPLTNEDMACELLEETVEALEVISPPVSSEVPTTPEPAAAKEKQAERKKRANMFVNLIKLQPKGAGEPGEVAVDNGRSEKKEPVVPEETNTVLAADVDASDGDEGSIHSVHSTTPPPKVGKVKQAASGPAHTPTTNTSSMTMIDADDDDDDDDVVLVSETRPVPRSRSRSRHARSRSKNAGERRSKKKKSKSRHRSGRGKKKSKKKSGSRSRTPSRSRSDRSASRLSRTTRKRDDDRSGRRRGGERSRSSSGSSAASSAIRTTDRRRSASRHSSSRAKQTAKRLKRTTRSRSRSGTHKAKRPSAERKRHKSADRAREPSQAKKRKRRSRSRSSRKKSGSDTETRNRRRRQHRKAAGDGPEGQGDERYPATRGRYWDC